MGCPMSKQKIQEQEAPSDHYQNVDEAVLIRNRDQEIIDAIKKDLNQTPETFVLNNVLMCTIFLNSHENIRFSQYKEKEQEKFWEPDDIVEKANKNVIYRPMHGPKKDIAEPLIKKRIYVPMNDIIKVFSPFDDDEDTISNDSSRYQVKIEESKRRGYVKLQRLNNGNNHDGISMKDMLVVPSSNTSGSSDTESTCTSVGMEVKENPQLIKDQTDELSLDDCFKFRKVAKTDVEVDLEEMDHENLKKEDVYDVVSYFRSKEFMKYFQSKVFRNKVAEKLGLIKYEIDNAVVDEHVPGKIFCNFRDDNGNCYPIEVLPCLRCSWPSKQTYEFLNGKVLLGNDSKQSFQWPTNQILNEIRHLDCALVPKGYSRKVKEYPEGNFEWEINFPLAEGYLKSWLRPEQLKCYLVLVTIYKEYIETYTKSQGVIPEHLLTLILWESEGDYNGWPEHRLGKRLINIIEHFSVMLSKRILHDYFIRKKNVFKSVPRRYLEYANETFHRIKQSPVMSIIRALRNLRYTSAKFYPPMNYKELLNILYKKDWDQVRFLDGLNLNYVSSDNISMSTISLEKKPKYSDLQRQLQYVQEKRTKQKYMEKKKKENNVKNGVNLRYNVNIDIRRSSCDSVNDDWECEKQFDLQKKIALLKFFINNYLEIAHTSFKIGSKIRTRFYLKQAWYLTKILEQENQLFAEEVMEFFKKIKEEEDKVAEMPERVTPYGSLNNVNGNYDDKEKELEEDLATLDDISDKGSDDDSAFAIPRAKVNADIHQQIRQTKINLKSLSRSYSRNCSQQDSTETFR